MMMSNQSASKWLLKLSKNFKLNWWENFKHLLLLITIISFSSNLFFKLSISDAYVKGLLVDYLIPKIYLFDCLLIINLIIFFFFEKNYLILKKIKIKLKKIDKSIIFFFIIYLINQSLIINLNSLIFYLRLILILLFALSLCLDKKRQQLLYQGLFISIIWQSILTYYQFFNQQSLAPYHYFGESNLRHFASVTRGQFLTVEKILPYGSTAHPNVLAGVVSIFSIIIFDKNDQKRSLSVLMLLNALIITYLTQSFSALLTLFIFLIYLFIQQLTGVQRFQNKQGNKELTSTGQKYFKQILVSLFFISPFIISLLNQSLQKNYLSISRRAMLNSAAWKIFLNKPLFGQGLGNFVRELEKHSRFQEAVRFVQPVHHLGLLLLSEGGLLIVALLSLIIWKYRKKIDWSKLLILTPVASLDHYLLTQPLGLISLVLFILLTRKRSGT